MYNLTFKKGTWEDWFATPLTENMLFFRDDDDDSTMYVTLDYKNSNNQLERKSIIGYSDSAVLGSEYVYNHFVSYGQLLVNKPTTSGTGATLIGCGAVKEVIGDVNLINRQSLTETISHFGLQNNLIFNNWSATSQSATQVSLGGTLFNYYLLYYRYHNQNGYNTNNDQYVSYDTEGVCTKIFTPNTSYFLGTDAMTDETDGVPNMDGIVRKITINGNTKQLIIEDAYDISNNDHPVYNSYLVPLALYGFNI